MSTYNNYVPDLAAFDQFNGDISPTALDVKFRLMRRNLELISKALNQVQPPTIVQSSSSGGGASPVVLEEDNYFVRIWSITSAEAIASDDIYATTGIKLNTTGSLVVDGELKII